MKQAGIYVRVSTSQQAKEGHSLQNQREACARYAESHDLEVVRVYEDAGVSGTKEDRPAMQQAIRDAAGGSFMHLIIFDSTRLGREQQVNASLRSIFADLGVQIHAVNEGGAIFDPETVSGVFLTAIMDARAKAENLDRAQKSRDGKYAAVKAGSVQIGNPPFGYDLIREGMDERGRGGRSVLKINEVEAAGVRRAFALLNDNTSIGEIARTLNSEGIAKRTGNPWTRENVRDLLDRETYAGIWTYGKSQTFSGDKARDAVSVKVDPIVDRKIFEQAQVRLRANRRAHARNVSHDYLLRGRIYCGICETLYNCRHQPYTLKNGRLQSNYYYQHRPHNECDTRNFKRDELEDVVKKHILIALENPGHLAKLIEGDVEGKRAAAAQAMERIKKEKTKLEQWRSNAVQHLIEGTISKTDFAEKDSEYHAKLETLDAEEQRQLRDSEPDPMVLEGLRQLDQPTPSGKTEKELLGGRSYGFWVEAMDVIINVTPEAVWLNVILGGIIGEELDPEYLTVKESAPASC